MVLSGGKLEAWEVLRPIVLTDPFESGRTLLRNVFVRVAHMTGSCITGLIRTPNVTTRKSYVNWPTSRYSFTTPGYQRHINQRMASPEMRGDSARPTTELLVRYFLQCNSSMRRGFDQRRSRESQPSFDLELTSTRYSFRFPRAAC